MAKKRKAAKRKKPSITALKRKANTIFSHYIRRRDCLENEDTGEYGKCCSCGAVLPYSQLECGHFVPGRHNSVLYDERNAHAQCRRCNIFLNGNLIEYYPFMQKKYGQEVIDELKRLSKQPKQFTPEELQELCNALAQKLKRLPYYEQVPL